MFNTITLDVRPTFGGLYTLTAYEETLELSNKLSERIYKETYYYEEIIRVESYIKGTFTKKTYIDVHIDDGFQKRINTFQVDNIQQLPLFLDYVNKKANQTQPETFKDTTINTNVQPFEIINIQENKNLKGELIIYPEGIQTRINNDITNIKYSQMQNIIKEKVAWSISIKIYLRTSTGRIKELTYFPKGHMIESKVDKIVNYINMRIQEQEYYNNTESLQTIHEKQEEKPEFHPKLNKIECLLIDERARGYDTQREQTVECIVELYDNYLEIHKKSTFLGNDRGSRKIYYIDITSLDYDRNQGLTLNNLEIRLNGGERVILQSINQQLHTFYTTLDEKISQTKSNTTTQSNSNAGSKADEILKWHDLYAKGIITKEEFEKQKQELLK